MKDTCFKNVGKSVQAPDFILAWLDRFYEPIEMDIIESLSDNSIDEHTLQRDFGTGEDELVRLLKRGVFSKNKQGKLIPANFHDRYDIWALFEGFKDIPDNIRHKLNQWELAHYIKSQEPILENLRITGKPDPLVVTPRYLLLDETFEVLDKIDRIFLWPCNCRSMINGCSKPVYTCLRFDNSQGQGYEISKERAKEIVATSNKKGLMQSGELGWDKTGKLMGAICNCCTDCCFPHLLAREKKAEKIWPLSRYIACWSEQDCSLCGLCAKRCPFDAFVYDKEKAKKEKTGKHERGTNKTEKGEGLVFFEDLCRGCGLCAVTCPDKAIEMRSL